jgi:hypothetical protein
MVAASSGNIGGLLTTFEGRQVLVASVSLLLKHSTKCTWAPLDG